MDLDGMDYDDLLLILKKEKYSEWLKKYQELKHESEMQIQENTYREMLLLLKLIKPNYLPCKIKLSHLPSDVIDKKTM
jgi:hypothetical protein